MASRILSFAVSTEASAMTLRFARAAAMAMYKSSHCGFRSSVIVQKPLGRLRLTAMLPDAAR
jgi:hypothetical protein